MHNHKIQPCANFPLRESMASLSTGTLQKVKSHQKPEVNTYFVSQDHVHKRRPLQVICFGAGIAGIASLYKYELTVQKHCCLSGTDC